MIDYSKVPNCSVKGEDNLIQICENGEIKDYTGISNLKITIVGNHNRVLVHMPSSFLCSSITMRGDNNSIVIHPSNKNLIRYAIFYMEAGGKISFGKNIYTHKTLTISAKSGKSVIIGDSCIFAPDVLIRNNDGHPIFDLNTGEIINLPEDVIVEKEVWFGARSVVLKGAYISEGSMVSAMALVNKKFKQKNIILAGVPAKKIKENISWDRRNYDTYLRAKEKEKKEQEEKAKQEEKKE